METTVIKKIKDSDTYNKNGILFRFWFTAVQFILFLLKLFGKPGKKTDRQIRNKTKSATTKSGNHVLEKPPFRYEI